MLKIIAEMVIGEMKSMLRADATIGAGGGSSGIQAAAEKKKPKRTLKGHRRDSADGQEGEAPPPTPQSKLSVLRLLNDQKEALFGQLLEVLIIIINQYYYTFSA